MKFSPVNVQGAFVINLQPVEDERGFFARAFCEKEFAEHGINVHMLQANTSYNKYRGMLRGLHWQVAPHEEAKLVRCTKGAIFDVIVDVRPDSSTFKQWYGVELTASNRQSLFIPGGCAHGYQVLEDDTEVFYQVSALYAPSAERGARWNDPAFNIQWPIRSNILLSKKDQEWNDFAN